MFTVGQKIALEVRCGKPTSDKALNLNRCWPMSADGRKIMNDNHIVEIQFNGNKADFNVGTEIAGNAIVVAIEDAKAYDEAGELQPRFALDVDGNPIVGKDGKDIILQRITVRWTDGVRKPALPAEAVLKVA